jgi:hypothetical protein
VAVAAVWGWETNAVHKDWARVEAVRQGGWPACLLCISTAAPAAPLLRGQECKVTQAKKKQAFEEWLAKQPHDDQLEAKA